ncbi:ATP-binding protein [Oryzifoliimicrobium ureilyticus]|uniref:ATP-binding protein n=1 Tax=Oryzifoliimicrobium ureilyticus TaxID=3113724 RepID=UPI0030761EC2
MSNPDNDLSSDFKDRDRRDGSVVGNRSLGRVVACDGARAIISATAEAGTTTLTELWAVGRLISISTGQSRVVALVNSMKTEQETWREASDNTIRIEVELLGEVRRGPSGHDEFTTGIARYPHLGAVAHHIRTADLRCIYNTQHTATAIIGTLSQDESIEATIDIPSMLSKHFAVLGSTGVGKSTAVTLLLRKAIEADPKLRILILDPHNEFAAAFPSHGAVINVDNLDLPFWLMRLEEFAEVVFRGRPPIPDELDVLRDLIPEAKRIFRTSSDALRRPGDKNGTVTVDSPVPYRMADLLALLDERIGRLEGRSEKPMLRSLKMRLLSVMNDPQHRFMFSSNTINDTIMETLATIFRIPGDGRPISVFQLAGIPSDIVNSVASVLCRMAFEIALWSNGGIHLLVLCEEAHRYIPSNPHLGFLPTRHAIARIAKEGRKYGVSLGIVTQRPEELDQTILSQCSTLFAMRLANVRDQDIIRSAIPQASSSTMNFISSMDNGEAIAFGEALRVPMRMRFQHVSTQLLPRTQAGAPEIQETADTVDLSRVVTRMRSVGNSDLAQNRLSQQVAQTYESRENMFHEPKYADEAMEPYRAEMLPNSDGERLEGPVLRPDMSVQEKLDALRREMQRMDPSRPLDATSSTNSPRNTSFAFRSRFSRDG